MDCTSSAIRSSVMISMISSMLMVWLMTAVMQIFLIPYATGTSWQFSPHFNPSILISVVIFLKSAFKSWSSSQGFGLFLLQLLVPLCFQSRRFGLSVIGGCGLLLLLVIVPKVKSVIVVLPRTLFSGFR